VTAFSGDAKDEIAGAAFENPCCPAAFWRAVSAFAGSRSGKRPSFDDRRSAALAFRRTSAARAALRAAKAIGVWAALKKPRDAQHRTKRLEIVADAPPQRQARRALGRACCRRAFVRGAFLACGSVEDPRRGYHLEFACADDDGARSLSGTLAALGIDAGVSRRRGRPLVYVKGSSAVVDLLGQMAASRAVLAFDDVLAVRATKNAIRRKVNCELANAARAASSAARQREAALRLVNSAGLARLAAGTREAIRLRIAHPERSLGELGALARPPVTKTTMAYRLRCLERLVRSGSAGERSTFSRKRRRIAAERSRRKQNA